MRTSFATLTVVAGLTVCAAVGVQGGSDRAAAFADDPAMTAVKTHRYRMAGRIRPLLFWIGRDDVGLAKLAWRSGSEGLRGYDMLVGTDPAKAPRGINRWGFISERTDGADGAVLAVMSKSDESSLGEAEASAGGSGGVEFKAMRAVSSGGVLSWRVARVQTPQPLTIHEVVPLLDRVRAETASVSSRSRPLSHDVRPGFLVSVAELVDRVVAARRASAPLASATAGVVPYVFGQQSYELRLVSAKPASLPTRAGVPGVPGCVSVFEILNLASHERTRFDMSFATEGPLSGVPIAIAWQPRWWLKVELALEE